MTNKFFIAIEAAFLVVFVLGVAAVMGFNTVIQQATVPSHRVTTQPAVTTLPATPSLSPAPEVQVRMQPAPAILPTSTALSPQMTPPTKPMPVADSDLLKLAAAVNLGGTNGGSVSKEVWARETPVAQKLLRGLCDCDQRNWLTHFVKTGNEALSGSDDYYQSVQLLAKLRRNDQELTANGALH